MINHNGNLIDTSEFQLTVENRAFKFGDGIFETIKILNGKVVFFEDHYFRLMASMRMLRMKIPMNFTLEFLEGEIKKVAENFSETNLRARLTVYRKDGGLYTPETNEIDYVIDVKPVTAEIKDKYVLDLYKDFLT
jgi:branched-chain amino acid aminotransferase